MSHTRRSSGSMLDPRTAAVLALGECWLVAIREEIAELEQPFAVLSYLDRRFGETLRMAIMDALAADAAEGR